MTIQELRKKNVADLRKELSELFKQQFNLRMQRGMQQAPKPHMFGLVRRQIARVKTVMYEKIREGGK